MDTLQIEDSTAITMITIAKASGTGLGRSCIPIITSIGILMSILLLT